MYIELNSVFHSEGESQAIDYSFSVDDALISTPIKVTGEVYNKTGIVTLKAKATFDVATECALCLTPLIRHATVPVKHILIAHSDEESEQDYDLYIPVDNMRLNLDDLVQEDIYLSLPSRFLCNPDCKGLCAVCGTNLNGTPCNCQKPTDPRWDALKNLI